MNLLNLKWYTIGPEPKDLKVVQEEANKYLKDKINATIDMNLLIMEIIHQKMWRYNKFRRKL